MVVHERFKPPDSVSSYRTFKSNRNTTILDCTITGLISQPSNFVRLSTNHCNNDTQSQPPPLCAHIRLNCFDSVARGTNRTKNSSHPRYTSCTIPLSLRYEKPTHITRPSSSFSISATTNESLGSFEGLMGNMILSSFFNWSDRK